MLPNVKTLTLTWLFHAPQFGDIKPVHDDILIAKLVPGQVNA